MKINAIFACGKNGEVGIGKNLPWRCEPFCNDPKIRRFALRDMKKFKNRTKNSFVIMGFNTFLTFTRPLCSRINIVIKRQTFKIDEENFLRLKNLCFFNFDAEFLFFSSIKYAIFAIENAICQNNFLRHKKIFVIGGAKLLAKCFSQKIFKTSHGKIYKTIFPFDFPNATSILPLNLSDFN